MSARHKNSTKETVKKNATGFAVADSAQQSTEAAKHFFSKSDQYTRDNFADLSKMEAVKKQSFNSNKTVRDPYTKKPLELHRKVAEQKYEKRWSEHLAETDHIVPLEEIHSKNKNSPWLTNKDIKTAANSRENLEVVSRKYNNAKRNRTNKEFVEDKDYLNRTGTKISKAGQEKAIDHGKTAEKAIDKQLQSAARRNIIKTGHQSGLAGAKTAAGITATISTINNITAVIKGDKTAQEAMIDTASDTGKAAAAGYVTGGALTILGNSLSSSSSKFIQALAGSNIPGKVITAVIVTGDTIKRYSNGEITTQECLIELGEKSLTFATAGYSMALGQAIIPIPFVGAAVGAMVGSLLASQYYNSLINTLKSNQFEHEERLRIQAECELVKKQAQDFRMELQAYLEQYFKNYQDCFDNALLEIDTALCAGDADAVITGANKITEALGGNVTFRNTEEFRNLLADPNYVDVL